MKNNLSVIITHKNRPGMLKWHLNELQRQTLRNFEVIVVDDHSDDNPAKLELFLDPPDNVKIVLSDGYGPNAARNTGVRKATSDTVLIVGDDTIPHKNLLFRHYLMHEKNKERIAVQGYSPFHPQVMGSEFMQWLDTSGLQANWKTLKNDDGTFREQVDGYCLTTNYSINKQLLLDFGGFDDEHFREAAWDDVSFGYTLSQLGGHTYFDPLAINYHFHEYDLKKFCTRQYMVGRNVWNLLLKHSEMTQGLVRAEELRFAREQELDEWLHRAYSIYYGQNIKEQKYNAWAETIHLALVLGMLDELDRRGKYWKVFEHLHKHESIVYALEAIKGIEEDNYGWAMHCIEWLLTDIGDNWAVYCFAGEVYKHYELHDEARRFFNKAQEIAPNEWKY